MNSTRAVEVSIQAVSPALICMKAPRTIMGGAAEPARGLHSLRREPMSSRSGVATATIRLECAVLEDQSLPMSTLGSELVRPSAGGHHWHLVQHPARSGQHGSL